MKDGKKIRDASRGKEPYPFPLTREDLGYSAMERNFVGIVQPNVMTSLLRWVGIPFSKLLHLLIDKKWLGGRAYQYEETLVETRDGAKLATDVYVPLSVHRKKEKCPTVMIRTPYWKDTMNFAGKYLALNGYAAVLQDVRGTAHSSPYGMNSFFFSEREDGIDTVRWIQDQYWYNGRIGAWGASYFGLTQWAISYDLPSDVHITCLNPSLSSPKMLWSAHNGLVMLSIQVDIAKIFHECTKFYDKLSDRDFMRETTHRYSENLLLDPRAALYNDPIEKTDVLVDVESLRGISFKQVGEELERRLNQKIDFAKRDFKVFHAFMNSMLFKGQADLFTENMAGMLDWDAAKVETPILVLNGWYDMFSRVAMDAWKELQERSPVADKCKIIIGPWAHGEPGYPLAFRGGGGGWMDFLRNIIPLNWFNYWLKDMKHKDIYRKPPIKLFVMGKNEWRWENKWPLARAVVREMFIHSQGRANSLRGDGTLTWDPPKGDETPDRYTFDPMNPVLTRAGNNLQLPKGVLDQRPAEARSDVLVYTSEPLQEGIEVTGDVKFVLHASSSAEDTDFMVKLCEVTAAGASRNVLDLGIRARYREFDFKHPSLIEPGKVYEYGIPLGPTSMYFKKGSRIRVDITSSDFPKYNINSNMGGKGVRGEWKGAIQHVFHDADHPSRLVLPVVPDE
ncbi:MAG: CocE/NonD family hydrolase [Promethearchaeota archaeon]